MTHAERQFVLNALLAVGCIFVMWLLAGCASNQPPLCEPYLLNPPCLAYCRIGQITTDPNKNEGLVRGLVDYNTSAELVCFEMGPS